MARATVRFRVHAVTEFGDTVCAVGELAELGGWDPAKAVPLRTDPSTYPIWMSDAVSVPANREVEYKYVRVRHGRLKCWEEGFGGNRKFLVPEGSHVIQDGHWGTKQSPLSAFDRVSLSAPPSSSSSSSSASPFLSRSTSEEGTPSPTLSRHSSTSSSSSSFYQSFVSTPKPLDAFAARIVEEDRQRKSWRAKLEFVTEFLCSGAEVHVSHLAAIAAYLHFINCGELVCQEDGQHRRPNTHALMAKQIDRVLASLSNSQTAFLCRRITPLLPSYAGSFTVSVPLTRIRDIAHRNDIPQQLKQEIKVTLQNKLHRCAGPEDLRTCEDILGRITAPGTNYSPDFVAQFRIFHKELQEFFNARSLDDRLHEVAASEHVPMDIRQLIGQFLSSKNGKSPVRERIELLTQLREGLLSLLQQQQLDNSPNGCSGAANGRHNGHLSLPDEMVQKIRLTEIGLEDISFVFFSEWMLHLSESPRAQPFQWSEPLHALSFVLRNLALSQVQPEECLAIVADVDGLHRAVVTAAPAGKAPETLSRCQLLRLKASLDRAVRIANTFSETVFSTFQQQVESLGRALGVSESAVRIFCEGTIRSHIVFQMSKATSLLLKRIRHEARLPPWEAVVPGVTVGLFLRVRHLSEVPAHLSMGRDRDQLGYVVMVDVAEGDEEIPACVRGILLGHDLPHLSHLAVRARQSGTVFAAADERSTYERLLREFAEQLHQIVTLSVSIDQMLLSKGVRSPPTSPPRPSPGSVTRPVQFSSPKLNGKRRGSLNGQQPFAESADVSTEAVLPLSDATRPLAGAKATAAKVLETLSGSADPESGFKTPRGCFLSFGTLHLALQRCSKYTEEYQARVQRLSAAACGQSNEWLTPEELEQQASYLRQFIISSVTVPPSVLASIKRLMKGVGRVMVRSSANVEDLELISGAGLYDSVADVDPNDPAALSAAILKVWSSLWSARATVSRHQAALDHSKAHMAVLVQEMIPADMSFVLHTLNPRNNDPEEVYMEVALGMGETLASAEQRGTPYRLVYSFKSERVKTLTFANFSRALYPMHRNAGNTAKNGRASANQNGSCTGIGTSAMPESSEERARQVEEVGRLRSEVVDYSSVPMTVSDKVREEAATRLARIGRCIQQYLGAPQDIEGLFTAGEVYVVQSRPQPVSRVM